MKWDNLSFKEKAEYIRIGVKNGIRDINDIKKAYHSFSQGGNLYAPGGNMDTPPIDESYVQNSADWLKAFYGNRKEQFNTMSNLAQGFTNNQAMSGDELMQNTIDRIGQINYSIVDDINKAVTAKYGNGKINAAGAAGIYISNGDDIFLDKNKASSTAGVHEFSHGAMDFGASPNADSNITAKSYRDIQMQNIIDEQKTELIDPKATTVSDKNGNTYKEHSNLYKYNSSMDEIYSRRNELLKIMNFDGSKKLKAKDLKNYQQDINRLNLNFNDNYKTPNATLLRLINEVASNQTPNIQNTLMTPYNPMLGDANQVNIAAYGGNLYGGNNPNGQQMQFATEKEAREYAKQYPNAGIFQGVDKEGEREYTYPLDEVVVKGKDYTKPYESAFNYRSNEKIPMIKRNPIDAYFTRKKNKIHSNLNKFIDNYLRPLGTYIGNWKYDLEHLPTTKEEIQERIYNNINPNGGYDSPFSRVWNAVMHNVDSSYLPQDFMFKSVDELKHNSYVGDLHRDKEYNDDLDDIYRMYLNIPDNKSRLLPNPFRTKFITESKYKPTKNKEGNDKYYALNLGTGKMTDRLVEEASKLNYGKSAPSNALSYTNITGTHTISRGMDSRGDYVSYYDSYDINPFKGVYAERDNSDSKLGKFLQSLIGDKEDISMGIGTPVKLYDRIYLDDYYEVPSEGAHYLPEVTITADSKKKYLGGNLFGNGGNKEASLLDRIGLFFKGQSAYKTQSGKYYAPGTKMVSKKGTRYTVSSRGNLVPITIYKKENKIKQRDAKTDRIHANTSKTQKESEAFENAMYGYMPKVSSPYDVDYMPEKSILINGYTTSTNILDSLAKYAGIHNRNLQFAEKPLLGKKATTRKISKEEALGLSGNETNFGARAYISEKNVDETSDKIAKVNNLSKKEAKELKARRRRAFANANNLTAFGTLPAVGITNNYHGNSLKTFVPPLLDAFRYYAQGDYNRGEPDHTEKVVNAGTEAFKNKDVQKWWNETGYKYFTGQLQ